MIFTKRALVFSLFAVSSSAYCADLGLASAFNAFIFGNATTNGGHSHGSIAIGGNWMMNYEAQQHNAPRANLPTAPNAGIYVRGNVITNSYAKVLRGNAYIGGTLTGAIDVQNGYKLFTGSTYVQSSDFSNQYAYSTQQAAEMKAMSGLSIGSVGNGLKLDLNANGLNGNVKVYNLQASQLNSYATVDFMNFSTDKTIIMNVHGGANESILWRWTVNGNIQSRIVWNFLDATNVTLERSLHGSVLAPNTHIIQQSGNIQGTLIAGQWTNHGSQELHSYLFTGEAPTVPVPEPATMTIMGLAAAAYWRRRRKA